MKFDLKANQSIDNILSAKIFRSLQIKLASIQT